MHSGFWSSNPNKMTHLETLDVDGRYIKMDLKEIGCKDLNCFDLA
jgi:hypothetical protein